jgi:hypothetical protein
MQQRFPFRQAGQFLPLQTPVGPFPQLLHGQLQLSRHGLFRHPLLTSLLNDLDTVKAKVRRNGRNHAGTDQGPEMRSLELTIDLEEGIELGQSRGQTKDLELAIELGQKKGLARTTDPDGKREFVSMIDHVRTTERTGRDATTHGIDLDRTPLDREKKLVIGGKEIRPLVGGVGAVNDHEAADRVSSLLRANRVDSTVCWQFLARGPKDNSS